MSERKRSLVAMPIDAAGVRRAAILVDALDLLRDHKRELRRGEKCRPVDGDWRGVAVGVECFCDAGSSGQESIKLDLATGRKLFPLLETLIRAELKALGVKP